MAPDRAGGVGGGDADKVLDAVDRAMYARKQQNNGGA